MECHGGMWRGEHCQASHQQAKLWTQLAGVQFSEGAWRDDFVTVDQKNFSSGMDIQFDVPFTWVDDKMLYTVEDGRMEIKR